MDRCCLAVAEASLLACTQSTRPARRQGGCRGLTIHDSPMRVCTPSWPGAPPDKLHPKGCLAARDLYADTISVNRVARTTSETLFAHNRRSPLGCRSWRRLPDPSRLFVHPYWWTSCESANPPANNPARHSQGRQASTLSRLTLTQSSASHSITVFHAIHSCQEVHLLTPSPLLSSASSPKRPRILERARDHQGCLRGAHLTMLIAKRGHIRSSWPCATALFAYARIARRVPSAMPVFAFFHICHHPAIFQALSRPQQSNAPVCGSVVFLSSLLRRHMSSKAPDLYKHGIGESTAYLYLLQRTLMTITHQYRQ